MEEKSLPVPAGSGERGDVDDLIFSPQNNAPRPSSR